MHRIASHPGEDPTEEITLVEQKSSPALLLTSATTDIATLSTCIKSTENTFWLNNINALCLSALSHPSQIDHYIFSSLENTKIIVVRLIGDSSYWSYGLEQLQIWQQRNNRNTLIIVSGTSENSEELSSRSSLDKVIVEYIERLFNIGGIDNINIALNILKKILFNTEIKLNSYQIKTLEDPKTYKWEDLKGEKVAIIHYNAFYKSGDFQLADSIIDCIKKEGLIPRTIWISSLRSKSLQTKLKKLFKEENIKAVITTTSFASSNLEEASLGNTLWDSINIPIFQFICSTANKEKWLSSPLGLNPIDLSLQVVMPELDGRISTRPIAFKTKQIHDKYLNTYIHKLEPDLSAIKWSCTLVNNWIRLKKKNNDEKKVCLIISNYPEKNGRVGNGVGLDTIESIVEILKWLNKESYDLGNQIPKDSYELIQYLITNRLSNNDKRDRRKVEGVTFDEYYTFWNKLSIDNQQLIIDKWGHPKDSKDLIHNRFEIDAIKFGNIVVLIQPSRGYDPDNIKDIHSPSIPPHHSYLAHYLWITKVLKADIISHLGKHGNAEWLPGKGIGLSSNCFPLIVMPPLPYIYPFIVNDPGEGSQAKRRTHAVIIDHLTPPLGLSGLYGELSELEELIDEYYEAKLIDEKRSKYIREKLSSILLSETFMEINNFLQNKTNEITDDYIDSIDSYICEIKNSQIRTGLHIFGVSNKSAKFKELVLSIARAPSIDNIGITQFISKQIGFDLDPWAYNTNELNNSDKELYQDITSKIANSPRDIISYIEEQSLLLISDLVDYKFPIRKELISKKLNKKLHTVLTNNKQRLIINNLLNVIIPRIDLSPSNEKRSFLDSLNGKRIKSGPSGAPSRGCLEVLPTGRNFYSVDIRGIPTQSAWDLGKRSSQLILDLYLQENGQHLTHLALSIWGTSTMRNGGEDVSQLLALIGIKPIWDFSTRRIIDLEIIPLSILQRPRVDVTLRISGLFRDAFPQLVEMIFNAQKIVSLLDEPDDMNPLASSVRDGQSGNRIYGSAPGSYGTGLQEVIDTGSWEESEELADLYMSWSKWQYQSGHMANENLDELKQCLNKIQIVLHNQDNREHDLLDSDDYYQFHGGLSLAVEKVSGKKPTIFFGDNSRYARPKIHKLEKEIDKVVRSRLLNPKWISGMKEHGYKGAFEMSASLDYLFAYDCMTNLVPDWCYRSLYKTWLQSPKTLEFIKHNNPWVLKDIGERFLEASNRGLWETAEDKEILEIKELINQTDSLIEKFTS